MLESSSKGQIYVTETPLLRFTRSKHQARSLFRRNERQQWCCNLSVSAKCINGGSGPDVAPFTKKAESALSLQVRAIQAGTLKADIDVSSKREFPTNCRNTARSVQQKIKNLAVRVGRNHIAALANFKAATQRGMSTFMQPVAKPAQAMTGSQTN
jgi:hypothetical protein